MDFAYRTAFNELTDKEIIGKILAIPHNEEAAAFLLHNRYAPLLHSIYNALTRNRNYYDDCVQELFIHLKSKDGTWHTLASFEWRSTLGCWLKGVARNKFKEVLPRLIGNGGKNASLDANDDDPSIQLPDVKVKMDAGCYKRDEERAQAKWNRCENMIRLCYVIFGLFEETRAYMNDIDKYLDGKPVKLDRYKMNRDLLFAYRDARKAYLESDEELNYISKYDTKMTEEEKYRLEYLEDDV